MKQVLTSVAFSFLFITTLMAQSKEDINAFNRLKNAVGCTDSLTTSEIIVKTAINRIGTPYVAGTLEKEPEQLIINIEKTDCILFVESCLAFALAAKEGNNDYSAFCHKIQELRYRLGKINGYSSRIHYTSEWIDQGVKNGYFLDMSRKWGIRCNQRLSYMSTHPESYKQLSTNHAERERIAEIEKNLNGKKFYYIPKNMAAKYIDSLRSGDIVGFNTSIPGMDISHVGIIYVHDGITGFIHASMKAGKVIVDDKTLLQYINASKTINGIRIMRSCR